MTKDPRFSDPVAISLVTGFLGSGKTTLMKHLLRDPRLVDTAVIVNEFGEVGLDHQLMEAGGQKIVLLGSGCVCCSLDGSLIETIDNLYRQRRAEKIPFFRQILIETTGLADPGPVIHELFDPRLVRLGTKLDRVITMMDAVCGWATLDRHDIAIRQAALANCILVSKADLAEADAVKRLMHRLAAINPRALITSVQNGEIEPTKLFPDWATPALDDLIAWPDQPAANEVHCHDPDSHRHHDRVATVALRFHEPISLEALSAWLEQAIATYGDDLLRIKGILNVEGRSKPIVIHGVQRVFHPAVELSEWPDEDRSSRLVFILYDIEPNSLVRSLKQALCLHDSSPEHLVSPMHMHRHTTP